MKKIIEHLIEQGWSNFMYDEDLPQTMFAKKKIGEKEFTIFVVLQNNECSYLIYQN